MHFRNSVNNIDCDLLFLTETWLKNNIGDDELELKNYNIFRADCESSY